jgi:hypothetical protein
VLSARSSAACLEPRVGRFTQPLELLDRAPPVRARVGRARRRPRTLIADRGYDRDKYRRLVRKRGVKPLIARRQTEHGSGLGRHRWVVEGRGVSTTLGQLQWTHGAMPPTLEDSRRWRWFMRRRSGVCIRDDEQLRQVS